MRPFIYAIAAMSAGDVASGLSVSTGVVERVGCSSGSVGCVVAVIPPAAWVVSPGCSTRRPRAALEGVSDVASGWLGDGVSADAVY